MSTRIARWAGVAFAATLVSALFSASPASAEHVTPVFVPGNTQPSDCAEGSVGFKIEPVSSGTKTNGSFSVVLTVHPDTGQGPSFDFADATHNVTQVFVKGGDNSNRYDYDPAVQADTGLHSPPNESGKWAGLSHIVFCYVVKLNVSKTAVTTFTRTWEWDILKSVDIDAWEFFPGDSGTSTYTVDLTKTGSVDSAWKVTGNITVSNPNDVAATVTDVTDQLSGPIDATVNCPVTFPHELPAQGSFVCSYEAELPDGTDRTNVATATTSGPVQGDSGGAPVTFGDPTTEVNDTINVDDSVAGDLGSFDDTGSTTYERTFTCDDEGINPNTATIVETGQDSSASVTVTCHEPPVNGCTLTQGYWKNHLGDPTWALLPNGSSTTFFLSGKSYSQVMAMDSKNAYYALAQQYVAATLNQLGGADVPADVQQALDDATALFQQYTPQQIEKLKGSQGVRPTFIALADVLDRYNRGLIGPGHCDS